VFINCTARQRSLVKLDVDSVNEIASSGHSDGRDVKNDSVVLDTHGNFLDQVNHFFSYVMCNMLTSQILEQYVRDIHSSNIAWYDTTVQEIISKMTPYEIGSLMLHLSDEDIAKVLIASYSVSDDKFDAVFNHIAQHRSSALWVSLSNNKNIFAGTVQRFNHPDIFQSLDKMLPVILPSMIKKRSFVPSYVLSYVFEALYAQPNKKALFEKYGKIISPTLMEKNLDPREVYRASLRSANVRADALKWLLPGKSLWNVLKGSIIESSSKFLWDTICSKRVTQQDVDKLRTWATLHGIPNAETMSGRELCARLANVSLPIDSCGQDDIDPWSQESMHEIPPYRWYKIGNNCFDIQSLHEAVKRGERRNPFDRSPLDVNAIEQRYDLIANTYAINRLQALKEVPMVTKQQYLTQTLANIWSVFKYPVSIDAFLKASETDLDNVMDSMISFNVIPLTTNEVQRYRNSVGKDKKFDVLVGIMQRILSLPTGELTTTIYAAMELALNENIKVRRRRRDEMESETESSAEEELEPPSRRIRTGGAGKKYYRRRH